MLYVENIVFYGIKFKESSLLNHSKSSIFYSDSYEYYYEVNNNTSIQNYFNKINQSNNKLKDINIYISKEGLINIRLYFNVSQNFDPDKFDCEDYYEELFNFIIKKLKLDLKDEYAKLDLFDSSYLFHQHIFDNTLSNTYEENSIKKISWSIYEYYKTSQQDKELYLDIDRYILEEHVLYNIFSKIYLKYMSNNNLSLEIGRKLLQTHRTLIANYRFVLHNFKSKSIEIINNQELQKIHNITHTKDLYIKLEQDFENLVENKERDRQYNKSKKLNKIILALTAFNIVSILLTYMGVMLTLSNQKVDILYNNFIPLFFDVTYFILMIIGIISVIYLLFKLFLPNKIKPIKIQIKYKEKK